MATIHTYTSASSVPWSSDFNTLSICDQTGLVKSANFVANYGPLDAISFANIPNRFEEGAQILNTTTGITICNVGTTPVPNFVEVEDVTGEVASVTGFYVGGTATNPTITVPKNNMTAVTTPTSGSDNTLGYSIGSIWFNTLTSIFWVAQTVGTGTATWSAIMVGQGGKNNATATTNPVVGSDNTLGYGIGSMWFNNTLGLLWVAQSVGTGAAVWTNALAGGAGSVLPSANILVGSAGNVATAVAMTGDVAISNAGATTIGAGAIIDSKVGASAAIAYSKLANLTSAHLLVGSAGNVATDTAVTGDVTIGNTGVTAIGAGKVVNAMLAADLTHTVEVDISSANVTGTSAGQFGHAAGVVLVADPGAGNVVELVSAMVSYTFATAAYTGGGNVTININGGAALTGLVSAANVITAGASVIYTYVPLSTVGQVMTVNKGLNLVSTAAPTQPGTAAGTYKVYITYRTHVA